MIEPMDDLIEKVRKIERGFCTEVIRARMEMYRTLAHQTGEMEYAWMADALAQVLEDIREQSP